MFEDCQAEYHFFQEKVSFNLSCLIYVKSENRFADLFSNALAWSRSIEL